MHSRGFATVLLLIVVLVGAAVVGAYYLSKTGVIPKFPGSATTSQSPAPNVEQPPAPPEVPDEDASREPNGSAETANWKTYTNMEHRYSFEYPEDKYTISEMKPVGIATHKRNDFLPEGNQQSTLLLYCPPLQRQNNDCFGPGSTFEVNTLENRQGYNIDKWLVSSDGSPTKFACIFKDPRTKTYKTNFLGADSTVIEYIIDDVVSKGICKESFLEIGGQSKHIITKRGQKIFVVSIYNANKDKLPVLENILSTFKFLD